VADDELTAMLQVRGFGRAVLCCCCVWALQCVLLGGGFRGSWLASVHMLLCAWSAAAIVLPLCSSMCWQEFGC
jgi:hypothetical protein